jgi:hypothetical protein
MRRKFSALTVALGVVALGTSFAPVARAGCGFNPGIQPRGSLKPIAYVFGSGLTWAGGQDSSSAAAQNPIVGLWRIKVLSHGNQAAGIPDYTVLDQGFSAWHSDGTEILNSGRDPVTTNFCLGTWKQTAASSYKLAHYTMSWSGLTVDAKGNIVVDPKTKEPLNNYIGPGYIQEIVTLSAGKESFQGTFSVEQFDQNGKSLYVLNGDVFGTKITTDSPTFFK